MLRTLNIFLFCLSVLLPSLHYILNAETKSPKYMEKKEKKTTLPKQIRSDALCMQGSSKVTLQTLIYKKYDCTRGRTSHAGYTATAIHPLNTASLVHTIRNRPERLHFITFSTNSLGLHTRFDGVSRVEDEVVAYTRYHSTSAPIPQNEREYVGKRVPVAPAIICSPAEFVPLLLHFLRTPETYS